MNDLMIFNNPEFGEIRTLEEDGETWFVGKDVAEALGYKNTRQALATNVDPDDRGVHSVDAPYGQQKMTVINESGLYSLILGSKLPTAKKFKRWVTSEVLPAIRKTGRYEVQPKPMTMAENLAAQAQLLVEQELRIARIEERVETALTAIARPSGDTWVEDMKAAIAGYCRATGLTEPAGRGRLYAMLDREASCNTDARLRRLRQRRKETGERRRDYMALTKLDAIAVDNGLRVAFEGIVARENARAAQKDEIAKRL